MTHANHADFQAWIDEARAVRVADELRRRGVQARHEENRPCPACGGIDRFAINTQKNIFICRASGAGGDAIALAEHIDGTPFLAAVETVTGRPSPGRGAAESPAERAAREAAQARRAAAQAEAEEREAIEASRFREAERRRCHGLWRGAWPIAGSAVEDYLRLRGLAMVPGLRLRCLPNQALWDKPGGTVVHRGPAMVAPIVRPDGCFGGIHMTWIDLAQRDGKARVPDAKQGELVPAKKVRGSKRGGRIELGRCVAPRRLILGEGIETVLSVLQDGRWSAEALARTAFWSGVDLGNIAGRATRSVAHSSLRTIDSAGRSRPSRIPGPEPAPDGAPTIPIPDSVEQLVLLRDMDSEPERTDFAMRRAAARFAATRPDLLITEWRPRPDQDFNDALREKVA